jgi:hypothetical protein
MAALKKNYRHLEKNLDIASLLILIFILEEI